MNLNIEITPEEIGSFFAEDFPAFRTAINIFADWTRRSGSYDEYMSNDASKEMAIKFATFLKSYDNRQSERTINVFRDVVEAYENA